MKRIVLILAIILSLIGMVSQNSQAALINFDNVASGTNINTQYSGLGVTFGCFNGTISASNLCAGNAGNTVNSGNAYAVASPSANSAPNVISLTSGVPLGVFTDERFGYFSAGFSSLVSNVSIDAKAVNPPEFLGTTTNHPFLSAYGSGGNLLGTVGYTGNTDLEAWETLTFNSASNNIAYVVFSSFSSTGHAVYGEFDNLNFGTQTSAVPEPSSLLLLGSGVVGLRLWRMFKAKS